MNATVTNFKATSYQGNYEAVDGDIKVAGEFSTNPDKDITNFSGTVTDDDNPIGSFNAYWNGNKLRYNISNADIEDFATVASAIAAAKTAVEAQIEEQ
ncbi:MAG: hypothetical protein J5692_00165 [Bacteroidales bacterium]|nr:hypothetical protein [Bacteroidales bacterium]